MRTTSQEGTMHEHHPATVARHAACHTCRNRGPACGNCVFRSVITREAPGEGFDADERAAIAALAGQGLVPPLRLAPPLAA